MVTNLPGVSGNAGSARPTPPLPHRRFDRALEVSAIPYRPAVEHSPCDSTSGPTTPDRHDRPARVANPVTTRTAGRTCRAGRPISGSCRSPSPVTRRHSSPDRYDRPGRWTFSLSHAFSRPNSPRRSRLPAPAAGLTCGRHELGRVQVAQRVRREVADPADAPVDVLQAARGGRPAASGRTSSANCSFHAPGTSAGFRSPDIRASSSSKRRMMCRLYVASSASTRMNDGRTSLIGEVEVVERSRRSRRAGNAFCASGKKCSQNGRPRPTWFSHSRDCDSWMPSEQYVPSGVPKCSAGEPLLVDPVAGLVQDAEERLVEELRVVAGCDAAVAGADAGAERVRGDVEPAGLEVEADARPRPRGRTPAGRRPGTRAPGSRRGLRFDWPMAAISGTRSARQRRRTRLGPAPRSPPARTRRAGRRTGWSL